MICTYCSEEIEDRAIICKHCGAAVMEPARLGTAEGKLEQGWGAVASGPTERARGNLTRCAVASALGGLAVGLVIGMWDAGQTLSSDGGPGIGMAEQRA